MNILESDKAYTFHDLWEYAKKLEERLADAEKVINEVWFSCEFCRENAAAYRKKYPKV